MNVPGFYADVQAQSQGDENYRSTTRDVKRLLGELAKEGDIEVLGEAGNGLEAVALAQSLQPDVVLMDIVMPRMTGLEMLDALRKTDCATPVVFMTSYESVAVAVEAFFVAPASLIHTQPRLYGLLQAYFQQDPMSYSGLRSA